ncbi:MAG: adenosylcobinamide-GDP ribazoletransferase [Desulforhopalus sp.]|nr:adenosylcobinamide-GDP ribazoletransferase [Desulforhopalus sp.]
MFLYVQDKVVDFCAALRFLTIFPLSWRQEDDFSHLQRSIVWFPSVGAMIGGVGALLAWIMTLFASPAVTAIVLLCYLAFVSNCMHLDGIADSADGLLSARSRERSLEIMKDSRIGAMGAAVLILFLLAKFAALLSISAAELPATLFFMPFAGRCAMLFSLGTMQYARAEGGIGGLFYNSNVKKYAIIAVLFLVGTLCLIYGYRGLIVFVGILPGFMLLRRKSILVLGGATGDIIGAQCELAELMTALTVSFLF